VTTSSKAHVDARWQEIIDGSPSRPQTAGGFRSGGEGDEDRGGHARVRCWPDRAVWLVKAHRACGKRDLVAPRRGKPKGQSKLKGHEAATMLAGKH